MTQNKEIFSQSENISDIIRLFKYSRIKGGTKQKMLNVLKETSNDKELQTLSALYDVSEGKFTRKSKAESIKDIEAHSGLMMVLVSGHCMERENIFDGDYILVDLDRYPLAEEADNALIYTNSFEMGLAVKQYQGMAFGFQSFSTAYTPERKKLEGRMFDYIVKADKVFGVVCACYTPDGFLRWYRDVSDRPHEMPTRRIIKYVGFEEL